MNHHEIWPGTKDTQLKDGIWNMTSWIIKYEMLDSMIYKIWKWSKEYGIWKGRYERRNTELGKEYETRETTATRNEYEHETSMYDSVVRALSPFALYYFVFCQCALAHRERSDTVASLPERMRVEGLFAAGGEWWWGWLWSCYSALYSQSHRGDATVVVARLLWLRIWISLNLNLENHPEQPCVILMSKTSVSWRSTSVLQT